MDFSVPNLGMMNMPITLPPFELGPETFLDIPPKRIIGIDITFTSAGKPPIQRSFLRSQFKSVHLGREPAEMSGVANAFARTDVVPPVMSRKHAEILFAHDEPQVKDIGSYHGTYFQGGGQRLVPHRPYQLVDGSVLEFGKSVTKDEKAHEPLTATIKFIREPDRPIRPLRMPMCPFSPGSPPRRYGIPSDSEDEEDMDEDESEDEDVDSNSSSSGSGSGSDVFEYTPSQQPTHIDLTELSDEDAIPKFAYDARDGIECLGFGYAPKNTFQEESVSSSDMSESEYEDDGVKVVNAPIASTSTLRAVPVLPEPIRLPSLMIAPGPQIAEPRALGEMAVAPRGDSGPSEEILTLKAELVMAQVEIDQLKRSLEKQAERERQADKDGDVQIAEPVAADMPTRIAKIEEMVTQLGTVGDGEISEHRMAVHEMLRQLAVGINALKTRVGIDLSLLASPNNKRKRSEEDDEEDSVVESRRAQSPMPASVSTSTQVSEPMPAPSPSKRSRITDTAIGVVAGGAAMWSALAFGCI